MGKSNSSIKKNLVQGLGTLIFLIFVLNTDRLSGQLPSFSVSKTSFSSSLADDFSPVWYKNGIVFCSNSLNISMLRIKSENEDLFNIVFTEQKDSVNWKSPVLFSESITTILNEGPATFSHDGNKIFFARNIEIEGKFKDINVPSNTLGIYSAELIDGQWTNIEAFPYNSKMYSLGTPTLSSDGKTIYFASDMPGGAGGTDIYVCRLENNKWTAPENLSEIINTEYNESYPYIDENGKLFFSSDKPGGLGGKDIYYSLIYNGDWIAPIHLDKNINSQADDYGILVDKNFEKGYFSSNRKGSADIYAFTTEIAQFDICASQPEFNKCFAFYDERFTDTLHLEHEWDFGHGIKKKGIKVEQCFDHPGNYTAVLTIINHLADTTYEIKAVHKFHVDEPDNLFILAEDEVVKGNPGTITLSDTPKPNTSSQYYWNLGQTFSDTGKSLEHVFDVAGENNIKLGVVRTIYPSEIKEKTCIQKPVTVFDDYQGLAEYKAKKNNLIQTEIISESRSNHEIQSKNEFSLAGYILADMDALAADSLGAMLNFFSEFTLTFEEDGTIKPESVKIPEYFVQLLKSTPDIRLIIAVHENSKGSSRSNQSNTDTVAKELERFFVKEGIENDLVECIGYGDNRPLIDAHMNNAEYINKRIEFIVVDK